MNWKQKFFESYNAALAAGYELYMEECGRGAANGLEEGAYEQYVDEAEKQWNSTPLDFIGGKTPKDALSDLTGLSDVLGLFKEACIVCDDGIPLIMEEKLKSFGNEAEDQLIELACCSQDEEDEAFMTSILSIRLLGKWKAVRHAPRLIKLLLSCSPDDVMLMEELELALVNIGDTGILLEGMGASESWFHPHEYLASALAKAGSHNRTDAVYKCLKEYFQKYKKTVLGASNLAEYGDSRAIPALRGYAQKHMASLEAEAFYEIKSAVESLGGTMDDLMAEYGRVRNRG